MNDEKSNNISDSQVKIFYTQLKKDAQDNGYNLNPDTEFTMQLLKSLLINEKRYGYQACPCRLAVGNKEQDLDIICPCDYRDEDLNEFGCCYCSLYVSNEVIEEKKAVHSIPERRLKANKRVMNQNLSDEISVNHSNQKFTVWRCKVCGYLCARNSPPDNCPICKAEKDRFEVFKF